MKYLNDYTDQPIKEALASFGGFFAVNKKQFSDQMNKSVNKYVHLYGGLYVPKENAQALYDALEEVQQEGIKQDIKENGIPAICQRELMNHEAHLSFDTINVRSVLDMYGVTKQMFQAEYNNFLDYCRKEDLF